LKPKKINSTSNACSSAARTSLVVAIAMVALFFALALGESLDAASAAQRKAFLVGVVLPRHASPGSRISGSLVTNPDDIAQDPRLIVEHVTLTLPTDNSGRPILSDAFVDAGDGRQFLPRRDLPRGSLPTAREFASHAAISMFRNGRSILKFLCSRRARMLKRRATAIRCFLLSRTLA
jgi:hypothetical protein